MATILDGHAEKFIQKRIAKMTGLGTEKESRASVTIDLAIRSKTPFSACQHIQTVNPSKINQKIEK